MIIHPNTLTTPNFFHHWPADNAAAIITLPARTGWRWVLDWLHYSYDDASAVGTILVETGIDVTGTLTSHSFTSPVTTVVSGTAVFYPELVGKQFIYNAGPRDYLIVEYVSPTQLKLEVDTTGAESGTDTFKIEDDVYKRDIVTASAIDAHNGIITFPGGLYGASGKKMVITLSNPGSGKGAKLNASVR